MGSVAFWIQVGFTHSILLAASGRLQPGRGLLWHYNTHVALPLKGQLLNGLTELFCLYLSSQNLRKQLHKTGCGTLRGVLQVYLVFSQAPVCP